MKSRFLLLSIWLIFGLAYAAKGQGQDDFSKIIQKCVDLPQVQPYYSVATGTPPSQLYILYHGLDFPTDMVVSKFGKPVLMTSKQGLIDYSLDVWLLFRELTITGTKATIEYRVYYKYTSDQEKHFIVNLELTKSGNAWNVTKTKTEER
jgi:hypothetical protein